MTFWLRIAVTVAGGVAAAAGIAGLDGSTQGIHLADRLGNEIHQQRSLIRNKTADQINQ
jgi:hypothetical protein